MKRKGYLPKSAKGAWRIAVFFLAILMLLSIVSCGYSASDEVRRTAIDRRYTAAYDSIETSYRYKYDFWGGDFVLVPDVKTVHHDEKYEVLYRITYKDGSERDSWETVGEKEWGAAIHG